MSPITKKSFNPDKDILDLGGKAGFSPSASCPLQAPLISKAFIVTGGYAGIGFGIVAHLLQHDAAKIILLSNKAEHAEEAIKALQGWVDVSVIDWRQCDLADLKQTHEMTKQLLAKFKQIDALISGSRRGD